MAKDKTKTGVPNKHLHARISYLQQAAKCLAAGHVSPNGLASMRSAAPNEDTIDQEQAPSDGDAPEPPIGPMSQEGPAHGDAKVSNFQQPSFGGLPLLLSSHLAQVARKSQIRLHPTIKHSICKRCTTPLIEGQTCRKFMENLSKGGRKPNADVLVLECTACGATKRWPVGAKRQERKTKRKQSTNEVNGDSEEIGEERQSG